MNSACITSSKLPRQSSAGLRSSVRDCGVPPLSEIEPVTETLHGATITDPYRWLEDQNSPGTRRWIADQTQYARDYLNGLPCRDAIRNRVTQMLSVETYGMPMKGGDRYFFLKRKGRQEQPCIYFRNGVNGQDHLLVDPAEYGAGPFTSVSPVTVSPGGRFMVFEVRDGGQRAGSVKILDLVQQKVLAESLPHGILRGLVFFEDETRVLYVHERTETGRLGHRAAYEHILGTSFAQDRVVFNVGEDSRLRLLLGADNNRPYFIVYHTGNRIADVYLSASDKELTPVAILRGARNVLGFSMSGGRVFLLKETDEGNKRLMELTSHRTGEPSWRGLVSGSSGQIKAFIARQDRLFVNYEEWGRSRLVIYDLDGHSLDEISLPESGTARFDLASADAQELFYSFESFVQPLKIFRYSLSKKERFPWAERSVPFNASSVVTVHVNYPSMDGTQVGMNLVAKEDALRNGARAVILTGYGGFGTSATPKFGALTSFMIEQGCIFALASLRGGSELGRAWHEAARRRNRQKAFDDVLAAAEWLIRNEYVTSETLAIFGGSNSGLLVGVAVTQRPELFRAAICINPLLDMLRYHHFDSARKYCTEYGCADDPEDFEVLKAYSPYHRVQDGVQYPAVLFVSGDLDTNCNPMHARKMTARLQAASTSGRPIVIDYKPYRGHVPLMPLSERIEGLTDRLSFLSDQLDILFPDQEEFGGRGLK
jgi:prolyl oligopeptidase